MRLSFKFLFVSVFALILGLVSGCATTGSKLYTYKEVAGPGKEWRGYKELPVYLDANFTDEEVISFKQTIYEWNYALNGYMKLKLAKRFDKEDDTSTTINLIRKVKETNEGYMVLKVKHNDPIVEDIIDDGDGTLAFVNAIGSSGHFMFVLEDRIGSRNLHEITLHEFGHLLGASHVRGTLMNPSYGVGSAPCVDKITLLQVANYWKLDLTKLNYCVIPGFE